jgi:hypothetical protein
MVVTLGTETLSQYRGLSLYNSPYVSHRAGCALDCYPPSSTAPSPVSGTILAVETVDAPPKPYAADQDHLIVVDTGEYVARILHVRPAVEVGESVARGDSLGRLVRSGFFAPWVDDHIHLGFRSHGDDYRRASGSRPIALDVPLEPLAWDGTGTVVETGNTYAVLDSPTHPDPGAFFVGLDGGAGVLDGGLPHYEGGGLLADNVGGVATLLGQRVGTVDGRTVSWDDVTVLVDGEPITGISLFLAREADVGVKLVCPGGSLSVGQSVRVSIEPA